MVIINRLSIKLFLTTLLVASVAFAEPETLPLLGGTSANLQQGSIAAIQSSTGYCTGTLVGPQEVLTAAHCANDSADNYLVIIANKRYSVKEVHYHPRFIHNAEVTPENQRFDIGMLILSTAVNDRRPVPILKEHSITIGEHAAVYGYGLSENSGFEEFSLANLGHSGSVTIEYKGDGILYSSDLYSTSSLCPGDSGGPLVEFNRDFMAIVGVNSTSTNNVDFDNNCFQEFGGESGYVDLQSPYSEQFLQLFPGVVRLSARLVEFFYAARELSLKLEIQLQTKNLKQLKKQAKLIYKDLNQLPPVYDQARLKSIAVAKKSLRTIATVTTIKPAQKKFRTAYTQLKKLDQFGVN